MGDQGYLDVDHPAAQSILQRDGAMGTPRAKLGVE